MTSVSVELYDHKHLFTSIIITDTSIIKVFCELPRVYTNLHVSDTCLFETQ